MSLTSFSHVTCHLPGSLEWQPQAWGDPQLSQRRETAEVNNRNSDGHQSLIIGNEVITTNTLHSELAQDCCPAAPPPRPARRSTREVSPPARLSTPSTPLSARPRSLNRSDAPRPALPGGPWTGGADWRAVVKGDPCVLTAPRGWLAGAKAGRSRVCDGRRGFDSRHDSDGAGSIPAMTRTARVRFPP